MTDIEKDAARYRWLKSAKRLSLTSESPIYFTREDGSRFIPSHRLCANDTYWGAVENLDDLIDSAMSN